MRAIGILKAMVMVTVLEPQALPEQKQDSFCALQVFVYAADFTPVLTATVELLDSSGNVTQKKEAVGGQADFCDFGFGYHSIRVEGGINNSCETRVNNIKASYGLPQKINVVFNSCPYSASGGGNACFNYIRVSSPKGEKLRGVEIEGGENAPVITDEFGRAGIFVPEGSRTVLKLIKEGFITKKVVLDCHRAARDEKSIKMRPAR